MENSLSETLLSWYECHARILPWREEPTPYRVWVSEIMLQQTRVEAVKPYYERFMAELPDIKALAEVEEDKLMKLWEGLGYYNRARNLKKTAQVVVEQYEGQLPSDYEELLKLPGIGAYTAGAISSIAYEKDVPAVDGNVLRVITRVTESYEDILKQKTKNQVTNYLMKMMPKGKSRAFNQALMELGAIVCVPNGQPKCTQCPWEKPCQARQKGVVDKIPVKTPKKARKKEEKTVFLLEYQGKIALHKREKGGLLSELWEFPNAEGDLTEKEVDHWLKQHHVTEYEIVGSYHGNHVFSHVEWQMKGIDVQIQQLSAWENDWVFATRKQIKTDYAIPSAFTWIKKEISSD